MIALVSKFNDGKPPLNDIPGRLRLLADQLEAGEHGEYESCLVIIPETTLDDFPRMFGYGSVDGIYNPLIVLQLALQKWINKIMVRK